MQTMSGLGVAMVLLAAQPAWAQAKATEAASDTAALAERIVGKVANVKEGEVVDISGPPSELALLEDLVVAARRRGAFPILSVWTEALDRRLLAATPEKYDSQRPKVAIAMARLVDVHISLPAARDPKLYADVKSERFAVWTKGMQPAVDIFRKRNVRSVDLSNGLAPSASRAKELGLSEAELTKLFWNGVGADYGAIEVKAHALRDALARGSELHVTHPNGTDLRLKVKGRKVFASDGTISDADVKAGGPAVQVWLPACDVFVNAVPGSAEGKVVDDRALYEGKEIIGLTAEVKAGKVTSLSAKAGLDAVKSRYDAAGPGKSQFAVFNLGCNPAITSGGKLETYMGAGMVSLTIGQDVWAGGTNNVAFGFAFQLPGTTVTLDGKPIVEGGTLK